MTRDELKRRIHQAIERRAEEIITLGEDIRRAAELGFKEVRTARADRGSGRARTPPSWRP
jgi:hypothetical protein